MTTQTDRELLKLALDALEQARRASGSEHVGLITEEAIAALRAALAEPIDEPERSLYLSPEQRQALQLERNAECRAMMDLVKGAPVKP